MLKNQNKILAKYFLTISMGLLVLFCSSAIVNAASASTTSSSPDCQNTTTDAALNKCVSQSPIVHDIQLLINFLSAGVGIVVAGVIILGGIQYTLAGDNPQALTAARQRIANGLLALGVFILIFAFLQWLVPGGIFG